MPRISLHAILRDTLGSRLRHGRGRALGRLAGFAAAAVLVVAAGPGALPRAEAHALRLAHLELEHSGDRVVDLRWRSSAGDPPPEVLLGTACRVLEETRAAIVMQRLDCAGAATAATFRLRGLAPDLPVVVAVRREDGAVRSRWMTDAGATALPWHGDPGPAAEFVQYLRAGARHVLSGADHLLFLLALFMLCSSARQLMMATLCFTGGHAASLVAVAGGYLPIGPRAAEIGIALTLVVAARAIAVEAAARRARQAPGRSVVGTAAIFGVIHGLGFAGALEEVGLQAANALLAVGAFNVGVELAQVAFILALALAGRALRVLAWAHRQDWARLASLLVGSAGVFWCLQRITSP